MKQMLINHDNAPSSLIVFRRLVYQINLSQAEMLQNMVWKTVTMLYLIKPLSPWYACLFNSCDERPMHYFADHKSNKFNPSSKQNFWVVQIELSFSSLEIEGARDNKASSPQARRARLGMPPAQLKIRSKISRITYSGSPLGAALLPNRRIASKFARIVTRLAVLSVATAP